MDLDEILAELAKQTDHAAVATAMRKQVQPLFQHIFDKGHATATAATKPTLDTLTGDVERLTTELAEARKARGEPTDAEKVRTEYQAKLDSEKEERKAEKAAAEARLEAALRQRDVKDVVARLTAAGVNDAEYAEFKAAQVADRLRYSTGEDGIAKLQVFQAGSNITIQSEDPLGALAAELLPTIPAKLKSSTADGGGGINGGGGGGGGGGNVYEKIRNEVKEKSEAAKEARAGSAAERLGARSPVGG